MTRKGWAALSLFSLAGCLAAPVLHFLGKLGSGSYKLVFLAASAGWFVFATLWASHRLSA
jgi:hypothetical protein